MNKILVKELGKLGIVFLSCILSVTGYIKENNQANIEIPKVKEKKVVVKTETKKEEAPVVEEQQEQPKAEVKEGEV